VEDRKAPGDDQGISFDVDQPLPFGEPVRVAEARPDLASLHSFRERGWAKLPSVDQDEVFDVPVWRQAAELGYGFKLVEDGHGRLGGGDR
jgi:hypothetical protein